MIVREQVKSADYASNSSYLLSLLRLEVLTHGLSLDLRRPLPHRHIHSSLLQDMTMNILLVSTLPASTHMGSLTCERPSGITLAHRYTKPNTIEAVQSGNLWLPRHMTHPPAIDGGRLTSVSYFGGII